MGTGHPLSLGGNVAVIDHRQVAFLLVDGGLLLCVQLGQLLRLFAARLLVGVVLWLFHDGGLACRRQRLVGQLEHALDGTLHVAYLIDQRGYHLLRLEHLARQHVVGHLRAVLPYGLVELLGVLVELGLQLLILALGSLAPPCVLLRAVLAYELHVAVAVLINGVMCHRPEGGHRAYAAVLVLRVHHDHAVAAAGQVHARRGAHAVDEGHGGLPLLAAVVKHHGVVVTAG